MKKNLFLFLWIICQSGLSLFAQESVVVPVEGQYYSIQHECGLYLTRNAAEDSPKICNPSGSFDQIFVFEPVAGEDGTYYIKNLYADEYMVLGDVNAWDMAWVSDPNAISNPDKSKYQIISINGNPDYIQIRNLGSKRLAPDGVINNTTVYPDKDEGNLKNGGTLQWKIKVYSTDVDKTFLQSKLEEAIEFFESTIQGNLPDQYPALTYNTLAEVISYAEDVMDDNMASQAEVNAVLMSLVSALQLYKDSVNPLQPNTNATYYIIHLASGAYLGDGSVTGDYDNVGVADPIYTTDQQFRFVAVPGETAVYNIMLVSTGLYLTRNTDNGWNLHWANDPTADIAQFQIKSTGTGYYWIKCMRTTVDDRTNHTMGTDFPSGTDRRAYIDKDGSDIKTFWTIQDIAVQGIVKTILQDAVDKVNDFLTYAVIGDDSDQYPATEYNALIAAKSAAETVLANSNATQSNVNDATSALNEALTACIASVNPFQPDPTILYNIIHYGGLYLSEYSDVYADVENGIAIQPKTGGADQQFIFEAAPDAVDIYSIKVLSLNGYLTRVSEPASDDYKLVWEYNPENAYAQFIMKKAGAKDYYTIKGIIPGPERSNSYIGTDRDNISATTPFPGVYADKDGKNVLHYWRIVDSSITNVKKIAADKTGAYAYVSDGLLTIKNLAGYNRVAVYTTIGQLVTTSEVKESDYTKVLSVGTYIVVVQGDSSYRGIVIVK